MNKNRMKENSDRAEEGFLSGLKCISIIQKIWHFCSGLNATLKFIQNIFPAGMRTNIFLNRERAWDGGRKKCAQNDNNKVF